VSRVLQSYFVGGFAVAAVLQGRHVNYIAWNPQPSTDAMGEEYTWAHEQNYAEDEQQLRQLLAELKEMPRGTSATVCRRRRLALKVPGRLVQRELRLWDAGAAAYVKFLPSPAFATPPLDALHLAMSLMGGVVEAVEYLKRLRDKLVRVLGTPANWAAVGSVANELLIHPNKPIRGEDIVELCRKAGVVC
jgi:hypothetical protein